MESREGGVETIISGMGVQSWGEDWSWRITRVELPSFLAPPTQSSQRAILVSFDKWVFAVIYFDKLEVNPPARVDVRPCRRLSIFR